MRNWRIGAGARATVGAVLLAASFAAPAGADVLLTVSPPAPLSFGSGLAQSRHSVSVRVRCRHSTLCAGHVVLRLTGQDGPYAGKTVDTESRYVSLNPGHSRVVTLRYSARAQRLLATRHNLSVRLTLQPA
jgi:hypothetical protein